MSLNLKNYAENSRLLFILKMSRLYLALLVNHYKHLWEWIKLGILLSTLDKVKSLTDDCYETSKCFYDSLAVALVFISIYQLEWFPYWCGQFPALIFVQIDVSYIEGYHQNLSICSYNIKNIIKIRKWTWWYSYLVFCQRYV